MSPEEFFHRNQLVSKKEIFEMRVKSLDWMLNCFKKGTKKENNSKSNPSSRPI